MLELAPWNEYEDDRKVIRVTFGILPYFQISVQKTFAFSIRKLLWLYRESQEDAFLKAAIIEVYSFLEMGYTYDTEKELFDEVVQEAGITREHIIPKYIAGALPCAEVKRADIEKIIKAWPVGKQRKYSKDELLEVLYRKIKDKEEGTYLFSNNEESPSYSKREVYQLVITKKECYIHDAKRDVYYQFSL